jgi:XTP/dITP diphosphohydrolase
MKTLLLATMNQGKLIELKSLLQDCPFQLIDLDSIQASLLIEETGDSYFENARIKASAYARYSNYITLADDSGLEVDTLGGAPGIYSARYSPQKNATDADRRRFLLENLKAFPRPWNSQFHCAVAVALPNSELFFSEGICRGEIVPEEKGDFGFGYDPIFFIAETQKTMAELTLEQKNKISHRGKAIKNAIPILVDLYNRYSKNIQD